MGGFPAAGNYLTDKQVALLLRPIHPQRVLSLKGLAYVAGHDIRAELNRVFGFCRWSEEILHQSLICESETKTSAGKNAWYVVYNSRVRLTVYAADGNYLTFYDGSHVGESTHPVRGEAHGNAITNSATYALRRAAINLGDQFGLSLYNKGSLDAIVRWTLIGSAPADTEDVAQVEAEEATEAEMAPPVAESKPAPSSSRPARKKPASPEQTVKATPESLMRDILAARTVAVLRQAWMDAGETGHLKSEAVIENTGEKVVIEDLLHRRHGELNPKSSPGTGSDSAPAEAGSGEGDS